MRLISIKESQFVIIVISFFKLYFKIMFFFFFFKFILLTNYYSFTLLQILRLSKGALTHISSGQVVNLLSNDVRRFDEICYYLNYIWITPIQVIFFLYRYNYKILNYYYIFFLSHLGFQFIIIFVILWHAVGIPSIIGISILLLLTVPTYTVFSPLTHQYRKITAKLIDKRMQLMNEFINGIQVMKYMHG